AQAGEAAAPLGADQEPERRGADLEQVAREDGQHLLVREDEGVHEDGDGEHAQDDRAPADLPKTGDEAVEDRPSPGPGGARGRPTSKGPPRSAACIDMVASDPATVRRSRPATTKSTVRRDGKSS